MRNFFSMVALAAVSVLLGSCGGGAFQTSSSTNSTTTAAVASLAVSSSVTSIPSDGSSGANITVVAKDANNAVVSGAVISFTASNGGNVTATQATTDSTGTAKATLAVGTAAAGATITVTATSGTITGTAAVTVTPTAASLAVTSDVTSIPSDGSSLANITVVAKNASSAPVSGVTISFTANNGGNVTATQATTDSTGTAKATLVAGTATAGATITVTATSGKVSGTVNVTVANTQKTVTLQTSSPQIPSDNSTPATITAFVKDANNNFVPGVVVNFKSSSGGLTVNAPTGGTAGQTSSQGAATATLSTAGDPTNRTITVTATLGSATANIAVNVYGTSISTSGPSSLVLGNSGTYTVALLDAGKKGIASQAVTIASSLGNTLSVNGVTTNTITTDPTGHASFTLTATKAGSDTVSATALGISSATPPVTISNQQFGFTAPVPTPPATNALIPIAASPCTPNVPVTVNWKVNGTPVALGTTVNFSATRGTLSANTAPTDANGNATVMICATTAGPATLSASGTAGSPPIGVSASELVYFVSTTPSKIDLQAAPSTVTIQGQSTLTAVVRDALGNLVQGQAVDFTLTDTTGGSLSVSTANTDVEGVAQTVYTASNTASATNGVSVTATVHNNTAINKTATLTVDGAALHISMGTGNQILENDTKTAFIMNWYVSVLDAASHPVPNQAVTLTMHSASRPSFAYYKGFYIVCGSSWVQTDGSKTAAQTCGATPPVPYNPPTACFNEDVNLTGVYQASEDINNNGKLDPGDVALVSPGTVTTDANGQATFQVTYPEDHALWVQATLTATASVSGTESSSATTFVLPILAAYLTTITSSPPGLVSPYGYHTCTDPN